LRVQFQKRESTDALQNAVALAAAHLWSGDLLKYLFFGLCCTHTPSGHERTDFERAILQPGGLTGPLGRVSTSCEAMSEITQILNGTSQDEAQSAETLLPLVYGELRKLAASKMALEPAGHTLQATALVHEAWLRLSRENHPVWKNREHFYAMAAEVMRRILVDRARCRLAKKRGGDLMRVELDAVEIPIPKDDTLVLQVHEALQRLEVEDPQKAEVVKLRFFVGLDRAETAAVLGISERTVQRHWAFAKAWLFREMRSQV
jgi:RNA polymerase sigma factor (TIGR02999 family)